MAEQTAICRENLSAFTCWIKPCDLRISTCFSWTKAPQRANLTPCRKKRCRRWARFFWPSRCCTPHGTELSRGRFASSRKCSLGLPTPLRILWSTLLAPPVTSSKGYSDQQHSQPSYTTIPHSTRYSGRRYHLSFAHAGCVLAWRAEPARQLNRIHTSISVHAQAAGMHGAVERGAHNTRNTGGFTDGELGHGACLREQGRMV